MPEIRVMVELRHSADLEAVAYAAERPEWGFVADSPTPADAQPLDLAAAPTIPGLVYDTSFAPVALPGSAAREQGADPYDTGALFNLEFGPAQSTYIVRATVDEDRIAAVRGEPPVIEIYSDPVIEPTIVCPTDPPVGSDADVERLLCTSSMQQIGMDGGGVLVAVVDTGVNLAYLQGRGKNPNFDAARSWAPRVGLTPGSLPVGHGTMVAYDVCIAAPQATLLDIALLQSTARGPTVISGLLSDAVRAYRHLIDIVTGPRRPGDSRSLVVNNSWGMFNPNWDFPPGDPGNYSDNPNHPFNRIVAALERAGADILFAAGNCGTDCADSRCQGVTTNAIYGANGHPAVLSVAGVDTTKTRVGYSTIGPGRLTRNKPDVCGYTHFRGSGVYAADGGTSAACPVTAGVVAAVRSNRPYNPGDASTHPAAIRSLITSTAEDLGLAGYDFQHGYGVVNGCALYRRLRPRVGLIDICRRYPWLCRPHSPPTDVCRRYPWLCRKSAIPIAPIPPDGPPVPTASRREVGLTADQLGISGDAPELADVIALAGALGVGDDDFDPVEMSYLLGWIHAQAAAGNED